MFRPRQGLGAGAPARWLPSSVHPTEGRAGAARDAGDPEAGSVIDPAGSVIDPDGDEDDRGGLARAQGVTAGPDLDDDPAAAASVLQADPGGAADPGGTAGGTATDEGELAGNGCHETPRTVGLPTGDGDRDGRPARAADEPTGTETGDDARDETPADLAVADLAVADRAVGERLDDLHRRVEELVMLRRHDVELVDRLHAENVRLRAGELTEALTPLLRGLMRLHDQMTSLGADDGHSVAGILRKQLLQVMDVAADVRPYTAVEGTSFDPARHVGVRRVGTQDAARDRTIARTVKPGFVRGESTVVRPAEVEVFRAR